ncbi:DoxX family protein [Nocardioides sp.]|uniref:DoxX family protein n=1 Tax=Nocardioides sp. TaxID=35761 RepID=UPI002727B97B|nr:DoxX family protein [Nocardioides sp.]MDO9455940.1 DoxX family protein [Nocardioides sp.]
MKTLLGIHPSSLRQDAGLLVLRVVLGVVMIAHGWQKLDGQGFGATADGFDALGIPLPDAAAAYAIGIELVGGVLLLLGALTPLVGLLVAADMAGAFWYVHRDAFFANEGGYELVLVLGAIGLALAATGAGRLSLDGLLAGRSTTASPTASDPRPRSAVDAQPLTMASAWAATQVIRGDIASARSRPRGVSR